MNLADIIGQDVETIESEVTQAADCVNKGIKTYMATIQYNDLLYSDEKEEAL